MSSAKTKYFERKVDNIITIRKLMKTMDFINYHRTDYLGWSVLLALKEKDKYIFSSVNDNDIRNEIAIVFGYGEGLSTFKHNHISKVYCVLPKQYALANPNLEQYRDLRDPVMFKYLLSERNFNSMLASIEIDVNETIKLNRLREEYKQDNS